MPTSLEHVAKIISEGKAKEIVVLVGAGVSTASGIPDFRSPRTGLYNNLKKYKLPFPEAIFDLAFFKRRPSAFYTLAQELYPSGRYRPNIAHYFFRLLHEKSLLRRVYTQNIDGLERVAGLPPVKLVEAHGTFASATCLRCRRNVHTRFIKMAITEGKVARCPSCKGLVKPDIVFFTENLPPKFWRYQVDMPKADLVLVMGTSLEVQPFANVIYASMKRTPRVLFNRHPVGLFQFSGRKRDHMVLGDISNSIGKLCDLLNWRKEIDSLMAVSEREKVDYLGLIPDINVHNSSSELSLSTVPQSDPVAIPKRHFSSGTPPLRSESAEPLLFSPETVFASSQADHSNADTGITPATIKTKSTCRNALSTNSISSDFTNFPPLLRNSSGSPAEDFASYKDPEEYLSRRDKHNLKISQIISSLSSHINTSSRFSYRSSSLSFESSSLQNQKCKENSGLVVKKIGTLYDEYSNSQETDEEIVFYDCCETLDTCLKPISAMAMLSDSMSKILLNT